jgi:ABC-2 type transport system ATP-binding protein
MLELPVIEVERLVKRYRASGRTVPALRELSFEVMAGEALALLGPNGAGKSTTVAILATLLRPDSGCVRIAGEDVIARPAAVRERLGVALQRTGLPRRQTARRLLRHHLRLHGASECDARRDADRAVERFALTAVADRAVSTYSGGQRQRLHVALALLHRPRVLLLDEPTTGLDMGSRETIWRELELALGDGATLIFTTHDLAEADAQADRVAVVHRGALVAHSRPQELKRTFGPRALVLSFDSERDARCALELVGSGELIDGDGVIVKMSAEADVLGVIRLLDARGVRARSASMSEPTLDSAFARLTASGEQLDVVG